MDKVYVQDKNGKPLMPTRRFAHVRRLLKEEKATVAVGRPFTIRLNYDTAECTDALYGGTDPGRVNIGNAVITEEGECVYRDKVESRNEEIPKLMAKRKVKRQARRRGERQVRKRLAKKHNTYSTKLASGRLIPGTKKATNVKDIVNQEARFSNRKRHNNMADVVDTKAAWVNPTVKQLVQTHLNHIDQILSLLPVRKWSLEANRFAFMTMEDGTVQGIDFQNGRLKSYASVEEFVYERQGGICFCCGAPIEEYHHIQKRSEGGSEGPENRIGVCKNCHKGIHAGDITLDIEGYGKKYGHLSVLNQAIPFIYCGLVERFGEENVFIFAGRDTRDAREESGLEKDHDIDALCIASLGAGIMPKPPSIKTYSVKQFRRHDRAKINNQTERTYKLDGETVAKNRKPRTEQEGPALSQWYEAQVEELGKREADRMLSRLTVKKSYRRYNNTERLFPGALIRCNSRIGILKGQQNNGYYYNIFGSKERLSAKDCETLKCNTGLVYM